MTAKTAPTRAFGWLLAGASSAAILSGAAALALVAESRVVESPMQLDLSMMPATAPNVAAVAEPAPEVMDQITQNTPPTMDEPPPEVQADEAPEEPYHPALTLPKIDQPVVADLNLPPPPEEPVVEPEKKEEKPEEKPPVKKAEKKPEKKKEKKKEKPKEVAKAEKKAEKKEEAAAAASKAGATGAKAGKAKGGANASPKAYQASVKKKIQRKAKSVRARGTVTVSFTISGGGALAGVQVAGSSGNDKLDKAGMDAVRRAAPFGPTPDGKSMTLSISFGN